MRKALKLRPKGWHKLAMQSAEQYYRISMYKDIEAGRGMVYQRTERHWRI